MTTSDVPRPDTASEGVVYEDTSSDDAASEGAAWEAQYAESKHLWSGRPNAALVDAVNTADPGCALDVGCGEGADVIWLAERGWSAIGIDLSPTAVERARAAAASVGATRAHFAVADVRTWESARSGGYDLVTCSFVHTHGDADRSAPLRAAAALVAPGGLLLVVSHAVMPPWAAHHDQAPVTPDADFLLLRLDESWSVERATVRPRDAVGPDGQRAVLRDSVLLVRHT